MMIVNYIIDYYSRYVNLNPMLISPASYLSCFMLFL